MIENKTYNIVWGDDEFYSLVNDAMLEKLKYRGYNIKGFVKASELVDYVVNNLDKVDAIITDANYGATEIPAKGDRTKNGLNYLSNNSYKIKEKSPKMVFWLYTGKYDNLAEGDDDGLLKYLDGRDKKNKAIFEVLAEIRNCIDEKSSPSFKVRNEHQRVFEIIEKYFSPKFSTYDKLLALTIEIEKEEITKPENYFNAYRSNLFEPMMTILYSYGFLPEELKAYLNPSINFLLNKYLKYEHNDLFPEVPNTIKFLLKQIMKIINDGSHNKETLEIETIKYLHDYKNPNNYLIKSLHYQIFEIILWFGNLLDQYSDAEVNGIRWSEKKGEFDANVYTEKGKYFVSHNHEKYQLNTKYPINQNTEVRIFRSENHKNPKDGVKFFINKDDFCILYK